MAFSVEKVWQINAAHFKNPVTLHSDHVKEVILDGKNTIFAKLAKSEVGTQCLSLGRAPTKSESGLSHTDILEQIRDLRDGARKILIDKLMDNEHSKTMEGKIDVSIAGSTPPSARKSRNPRASRKRVASPRSTSPSILQP